MKQIILLLLLLCISCEKHEYNIVIGTEWNNYSMFHYQVLNFETSNEGVLHIDINNKISSQYFTYSITDNNICLNFGTLIWSGTIINNEMRFNNHIFKRI